VLLLVVLEGIVVLVVVMEEGTKADAINNALVLPPPLFSICRNHVRESIVDIVSIVTKSIRVLSDLDALTEEEEVMFCLDDDLSAV